jgi:hypothetical protein
MALSKNIKNSIFWVNACENWNCIHMYFDFNFIVF